MKANAEHVVPLSGLVLDLLAGLPREDGNAFVFIGRKVGRGLGADALVDVLAALGRHDLTVHGFRSSFRDWSAEQTAFSREVCEAALAHTVGDASERAYRRTKQLPRRRQLMDAWATFCMTAPVAAGGNVVSLGR
jgi:integrase